ncbi:MULTISPECIES: fumarylacetoacetate hydrolase family protein [Rhodopseudomonas]|uniref:2-hydroxyhepta-2,4-diene-1,7-dioate isomerase n=1 Tax=Rhodopseudomonas palustris TaxID=1076 RepID=A0A0D7F4L7_RHOPL|nr:MULTISPECIES: fumarylacetoacetate hydrolase family protein [Rhodopseudomonas]KIZ47706.1 2-hydroxyhepta-2,4-diene-1,7-dioate isomerase [Rhodopseudomonas palustris]MDF3811590.1 fumarylacetoacetate hydrolase family protein [Rhodopseudomonas sp. BAL398]WOK19913.1 fumarylacetoacetate hydrolase family protein [Rhodopseudomonas sp. BAL398]
MTCWVRFRHNGTIGFGTLSQSTIAVHVGDMFDAPTSTGQTLALAEVALLAPAAPSKIIALWNNFHALAAKLKSPEPAEPLYFLKAPSSVAAPGAVVNRPASYDGKVVYEGELGIVIGKPCSGISEQEADAHIFGYTCVNDITAAEILNRDPTFPQWARAKSFDGFGPFGPAIAAGIDPAKLSVRTILNGAERQNYPVADMIFSPQQVVARISHDMTLLPGDLICCGTSVGVGAMKEPINKVTIAIDSIGELHNEFHG